MLERMLVLLWLSLAVLAPHAAAAFFAPQEALMSFMRPFWSRAPNPPTFPNAFETEYTFSLPYVKVVQTTGLSFPVHLWYDGEGGRLRVDVYGGLDRTIQTDPDTVYTLYPRINTTICDVAHSEVGPTRLLGARLLADAPLPDVTSWSYAGSTSLAGKAAHIWTRRERHAQKTNIYSLYVTEQGEPLRLYMMGTNVIQYSHFDEYLVDFVSWRPGKPSDKAFEAPNICEDAKRRSTVSSQANKAGGAATEAQAARVMQAAALMPWGCMGSAEGVLLGGSKHDALLLRRLAARAEGARFVTSWDAAAAGFGVALNHLSDMLPEEYSTLLTARRVTPGDALRKSHLLGVFTAEGISKDSLPDEVDWRGTGADNVVKDQATCGSCWAFAASGAMEGAWYVATGEMVSLSEQQLVDCSWDYGNNGCGGGNMEPAIQYITDAGGAMSEEAYQYLGQNAFCGVNATYRKAPPAAKFLGFAQVEPRDETALMAAVATLGPVAVSIDASQLDFKFYSHGVYHNKKCKKARDELDHAVLVVGYGTTDEGEDYWLIKNSWSTYWGSTGYIKMRRTSGSGNDCGVLTDPVVAIVQPEAAALAAKRLGRQPKPMPRLVKPARS